MRLALVPASSFTGLRVSNGTGSGSPPIASVLAEARSGDE